MSLRALPLPLLCLLLGLVACDQREAPAEATPRNAPPMQSAVAPGPQAPGFYIGRWAKQTQDCPGRVWTFTADRLVAPPGVCIFDKITPVAQGIDIDADCSWDGETVSIQMRLSYAQSARALLVMEGPGGDLGLVACPGA